jgi:hypothetical protein
MLVMKEEVEGVGAWRGRGAETRCMLTHTVSEPIQARLDEPRPLLLYWTLEAQVLF